MSHSFVLMLIICLTSMTSIRKVVGASRAHAVCFASASVVSRVSWVVWKGSSFEDSDCKYDSTPNPKHTDMLNQFKKVSWKPSCKLCGAHDVGYWFRCQWEPSSTIASDLWNVNFWGDIEELQGSELWKAISLVDVASAKISIEKVAKSCFSP